MKTHIFFTMFVVATMLIISCKEEDNRTPQQMTESYTYSQNIRGATGVKGELPLPDLILTDIIEADIVNNLTKAELQLADTYLEISGLEQLEPSDTVAVVLEDFTIKIGTRPGVNLGNISTNPQGVNELESDVRHSTNEVVNLIQTIFSEITSANKRAQITVSFTPNVDIDASDNVQLNIHFGGRYHYMEFE